VAYFLGHPVYLRIAVNVLYVCSAIIYDKTVARAHSGHSQECGPAPDGR